MKYYNISVNGVAYSVSVEETFFRVTALFALERREISLLYAQPIVFLNM